MPKVPKSIEDQIITLQQRNMSFRNIENARHFLSNISYYRLKGYWWEMQDDNVHHHFRNGSFFEDAIDAYNFDRRLRLIAFNAIERIEIALRAKLIYHLSLAYGPEWYLDPSLFDKPCEFAAFVSRIYSDMSRSSEEFVVRHFANHPSEHPESWKALEVLTLGALSKLYKNLGHQLPEKNIIAREFGIYNQKHLASWLLTITLIRNIIAHHSRLWNRTIINKYDWPPTTAKPLLSFIPNDVERAKLFPILSAIIYMNDHISPGHHVKGELLTLFNQFSRVPLARMGFPQGWQNEPAWH